MDLTIGCVCADNQDQLDDLLNQYRVYCCTDQKQWFLYSTHSLAENCGGYLVVHAGYHQLEASLIRCWNDWSRGHAGVSTIRDEPVVFDEEEG